MMERLEQDCFSKCGHTNGSAKRGSPGRSATNVERISIDCETEILGYQNSFSDKQNENTDSPRLETLPPGSNATEQIE
jgi:hypothetical protein